MANLVFSKFLLVVTKGVYMHLWVVESKNLGGVRQQVPQMPPRPQLVPAGRPVLRPRLGQVSQWQLVGTLAQGGQQECEARTDEVRGNRGNNVNLKGWNMAS